MRYQVIRWRDRDCFLYIVLKDMQKNKVLRYDYGNADLSDKWVVEDRINELLDVYFDCRNAWMDLLNWNKEYESDNLEECKIQYMVLVL